jgi:hypothetical protein
MSCVSRLVFFAFLKHSLWIRRGAAEKTRVCRRASFAKLWKTNNCRAGTKK